jgi:hypothetical protein
MGTPSRRVAAHARREVEACPGRRITSHAKLTVREPPSLLPEKTKSLSE